MIIVDASVLAYALTDDGPVGQAGRRQLARDAHWAGPEHLVVETFSAIRGRLLGGKVDKRRAGDAFDALAASTIELLPTVPLLLRMRELIHNVSGYDAAYVAAAEAYGCALVTADARLARAHGPRCEIRFSVS